MLFPEKLTPPPLIAGMLLPQGTEAESFSRIARLERPPPPRYVLARQLFVAVLTGQPFDWAVQQARDSNDASQRGYALDLLRTAKTFLHMTRGLKSAEPPTARWGPAGGLELPVATHAVTGQGPSRRVMVLHFWRSELPAERLALIKGAFRSSIWRLPGFAGTPIDLVTAPVVPALGRRNLKIVECTEGAIAGDDELDTFHGELASLWDRYHEVHPIRRWH